MGKFTGKAGKAGKKSKPRVSAFARAAAESETHEKGDEFDVGTFRVKLTGSQESESGSIGFTFVGAGDDEEIGERIAWFSTKGKATYVSAPRVKSLAMALLGMSKADEDTYNEFDPNGVFLDKIITFELDAAAEYMAEHEVADSVEAAREALDEAEVLIKVSKGGEKDDGGFFRNASFKPVDGESDEEDSEDDEDEPESERKPAKKKASKKAARAKGKSKMRPSDNEDEYEDDDSDDEDEPESERKPAKKKARRK